MDDTISPRKAAIAARAFHDGLLVEDAPLIGVIDTDALYNTIHDLRSSFPNFFTHAFAAKANTMPTVLDLVRKWGMACEVASPGEYQAAVKAGFVGGENRLRRVSVETAGAVYARLTVPPRLADNQFRFTSSALFTE